MPLELAADPAEVFVPPGGTTWAVGLRASRPGAEVTVFRLTPDAAVRPYLRARSRTPIPFTLKPGEATRVDVDVAPTTVRRAGTIRIFAEESGLTTAAAVPITLVPDRAFAGVLGVSAGATGLHAAAIAASDPFGTPAAVPLAPGGTRRPTHTTLEFDHPAARPTLGDPSAPSPDANVVLRPPRLAAARAARRWVARSGREFPGDAGDVWGWLLTDVIHRVRMADGLGRPSRTTLALPSYLTPAQAAAVESRFSRDPSLAVRVHPTLAGAGRYLDELTALALLAARADATGLAAAARAGSETARYLVVDAGAEFVQAGVVELGLTAGTVSGVRVCPRLAVRAAVPWMAGDSITAAVFQRLKASLGDGPGAVPTVFGDVPFGPARDRRQRDFLRLWHAAERVKLELGKGAASVTTELPEWGDADAPARGRVDEAQLAGDLEPQAVRCAAAIANALYLNTDGEVGRLDRVVWAGGAARLPLFRQRVLSQILAWYENVSRAAPPRVTDFTPHAEAVALGAAVATHFAAPEDATGDFLVHFTSQYASLPHRIVYGVGGDNYVELFPSGSPFPLVNGKPEGVATTIRTDQLPEVVELFSCPGPRVRSAEGVFLATHLGHFVVPSRVGTLEIRIDLDHAITARYGGSELAFQPDDITARGSVLDIGL